GSSITLIRPDGRIADDSRVLHDPRNDSRQFATALTAKGNYISPEYISRVTHQKQFSYVYRRTLTDGGFNGAVVVSIPVATIGTIFGMHRPGVQSLILHDNGQIVASVPPREPGSVDTADVSRLLN